MVAVQVLHTGLASWFNNQTAFTATADFGAYVFEPMTDTLWIGFSPGTPGNVDAALLASSDALSLTAVYSPTEQGLADFQAITSTDKLYISGVDPAFGDDWSLGNLYIYQSGAVTKRRTLTNVIHTLGLWVDGGVTYAATGAHLGDNVTWSGQVFTSTSDGVSWSRPVTVTSYRVYDIIGFDGDLYATGLSVSYGRMLNRSTDGGATWATVGIADPVSRARTALFDGKLIGVQHSRTQLFSVAAGGSVSTHNLPFTVPDWWNVLADGGGYLYVLAEGGRVYRSSNLSSWVCYANTNTTLIAIAAWPDQNVMVLADQGLSAKLWTIPRGD